MEKNIFLSEGRIKRSTYWERWLISFLITIPFRNEGLINFSGIVSIIISIFMIIQGIKRMHDVNKSGWYTLIPIYNLILALSMETKDQMIMGLTLSIAESLLIMKMKLNVNFVMKRLY